MKNEIYPCFSHFFNAQSLFWFMVQVTSLRNYLGRWVRRGLIMARREWGETDKKSSCQRLAVSHGWRGGGGKRRNKPKYKHWMQVSMQAKMTCINILFKIWSLIFFFPRKWGSNPDEASNYGCWETFSHDFHLVLYKPINFKFQIDKDR